MALKEEKKLDQYFKGQTGRLPEFAVPNRYDLNLRLDLLVSNFSGFVIIDVFIKEPTKFIVLNALQLKIHKVCFSKGQKYVPCDVVVDSDDEILVLVFDKEIDVGSGFLEIEYSGELNEHLKGLYRCTYMDRGEKKNMAATQFEAVNARRCFPCWDEPALKAKFKITLENIPSELTALSNMPISEEKILGNYKTVHFEESIVMSTYLVAVVVGPYDYIEDITKDGIKVRAYCPIGKSEKGKLSLDIAVKTLDFFTSYFSMAYPLPKLDMVTVPEFPMSGMENYGLITCRETELLQDENSAVSNIQWLTIVVAHEVAHHWFGNLVTMEWWTHLWLNEGFATWVSYLVTDKLFAEWKIWNKFLQETVYGLSMDSLEESHPIEVDIRDARSVHEYFDAISYQKGSSVVRMLESYLGYEIFQKSLGSYMKEYAFRNAKTEDLWSVISETSGVEVNSVMQSWTKQQGYPVISVKLNDSTLEFEQRRFLSSGLECDTVWKVPLTLCHYSYDNQKRFLLEEKVGQLDLGDTLTDVENCWIKVNIHQAGFYRVKYDDNLAAQLRIAIANNSLSAADEFGVLDDLYALCEACLVPFSSLLSLMGTYRKENLEYIVLSKLIDVCYSVSRILKDSIPQLATHCDKFFVSLLTLYAEKLGWEAKPGEIQLNSLMREGVMVALVTFGHTQTTEEAIKRFHAYVEDNSTPPLQVDTRKAAYVAVIRNTSSEDRSGFQMLINVYREVEAVQEKARILRYIASSPEPTLVIEALNFMLSDEVRHQDAIYVLWGISWEGRSAAWKWLKENWDRILKKWGTEMLLRYFIRGIIAPMCSEEMANEVEEFFAMHPVPSITLNLKQSLELVRIKAKWVRYIIQEEQLITEMFLKLVAPN